MSSRSSPHSLERGRYNAAERGSEWKPPLPAAFGSRIFRSSPGCPKSIGVSWSAASRSCSFGAGDRILSEGDQKPGRLYVVLDGEAAICKTGRSLPGGRVTDYEIAVRRKNEVFGEISFLDGKPASNSVVAKTPLTLAVLDCTTCDATPSLQRLRVSIIGALREQLAAELREFDGRPVRHYPARSRVLALQDRDRPHPRHDPIASVFLHAALECVAEVRAHDRGKLCNQPLHHLVLRARAGAGHPAQRISACLLWPSNGELEKRHRVFGSCLACLHRDSRRSEMASYSHDGGIFTPLHFQLSPTFAWTSSRS